MTSTYSRVFEPNEPVGEIPSGKDFFVEWACEKEYEEPLRGLVGRGRIKNTKSSYGGAWMFNVLNLDGCGYCVYLHGLEGAFSCCIERSGVEAAARAAEAKFAVEDHGTHTDLIWTGASKPIPADTVTLGEGDLVLRRIIEDKDVRDLGSPIPWSYTAYRDETNGQYVVDVHGLANQWGLCEHAFQIPAMAERISDRHHHEVRNYVAWLPPALPTSPPSPPVPPLTQDDIDDAFTLPKVGAWLLTLPLDEEFANPTSGKDCIGFHYLAHVFAERAEGIDCGIKNLYQIGGQRFDFSSEIAKFLQQSFDAYHTHTSRRITPRQALALLFASQTTT